MKELLAGGRRQQQTVAQEARSDGVGKAAGKKAKSGRGNFFAVERITWDRVCSWGNTNAATAFLVLAQGSGADHITTSWSANAVSIYTGMTRARATEAIAKLQRFGVLEKVKGGTKPQYKIKNLKPPKANSESSGVERIWLPNALVTGARSEPPPLARIRATQDILLLRLFIDLYRAQNLTDDGGISRNVIFQKYEREEVGKYAEYTVYAFTRTDTFMHPNHEILRPHKKAEDFEEDDEEEDEEDAATKAFWERLSVLQANGLIHWVTYLCETAAEGDGELIHPCTYDASDTNPSIEKQIGTAAHRAGEVLRDTMIGQGHKAAECYVGSTMQFVPVRQQFRYATLIGIARLHYRPHTKKTSAWWQNLESKGARWVSEYQGIAEMQLPGRLRAVG